MQTNIPGPEVRNSQESVRVNTIINCKENDEEISFESAPINISKNILGNCNGNLDQT